MIAKMKYIYVVCMKDDRDKLLGALQKSGMVELCESADGSASPDAAASAQKLMQSKKLLSEMAPYTPKKKPFEQPAEVGISEFEKPCDGGECGKMQSLLDALNEASQEYAKDKELYKTLIPWENLTVTPAALDGTYSSVQTGTVPLHSLEAFRQSLTDGDRALDVVSTSESTAYCVLIALKGESRITAESAFEAVTLPALDGTVKENTDRLEKRISRLAGEIEEKKAQLSSLASQTNEPAMCYEQDNAQYLRDTAPVIATMETVVVEGWTPADKLENVEKTVAKVIDVYAMSSRDPEEGESAPTLTENNRIVSQYEGITSMFDPPAYGGFDPNAVMAPWYWIIFGLMMGDFGYGLMMVLGCLLLKKIMKPKGNTLKLVNVILYSSVTTMICGILFGSYFGETWHPILFSPFEDPMKMLILTLVVGALHIITGMITKMVLLIKDGKVWDALFDELSWIFIIVGAGCLFVSGLSTVGMILAGVGAATVLLTAGRHKKGVFGKISGGLLGLYGITSYLSDILSYSRILALSLATGVIGMVMNLLAGMLQGFESPVLAVVGFIFSLAIYVVGHVFNLALGLLSAYVHDCRLQYIEFYNKFYDGGGKLFKPFALNTKYISLKDDGGNNNV